MLKKQTASAKQTSLFDIRLKNLDHDVLVLKGGEQDASSVLLSGKIVISVNEPLNIKKLSLRLYATLRLNWVDKVTTPKGVYPKPQKFEKKIYEYLWDTNEINLYLSNFYDNSQNNLLGLGSSRVLSTTSLKNLGLKSKSSSNLSSLYMSPKSGSSVNLQGKNSHVLVQGNYEIPFKVILPGSIPESVEGLPGGSLTYKLEALIDRGKFHNNMIAKKSLRVIRTLTTDAVELSETVAVDNTWPNKVEYSLNVPCKAIAIGAGTPISFMMVPLLKGLRLGDIKIQLVEYWSYAGYLGIPYSDERIVSDKFIPAPDDNDPRFQMDKWEIDTFLKVPVSLSKCTQDCDILNHLKVRHKLKFVIGLRNPDNHVSELRASLPIQLFISPFVSVSAKYDDEIKDSTSPAGDDGEEQEELLFSSDIHSGSHTSLNQLNSNSGLQSGEGSITNMAALMAPPLYEKHVYDRLWSDVSPVETPINSGASTPRGNLRNNNVEQFSMSPLDSVLLNENLRQLSIQRQLQESEGSTPNVAVREPSGRAVFNLDEDSNTPYNGESQGDYFSKGRANNGPGILSPGILSPNFTHLSRAGSETNLLDSSSMSRLPSYNQAIRSEVQDEVLSPVYQPPLPGSNINLAEVNKRFEEMNTHNSSSSSLARNKSFLSRGSSFIKSRNSSGNSSPSHSRNVSSTNLASMGMSSTKRDTTNGPSSPNGPQISMTGSASFSMNPTSPPIQSPPSSGSHTPAKTQESSSKVNPPLNHSSSTSTSSIAKPSSSASDRSAALNAPIRSSSTLSLHNLHFLHKKKDKK